PPVNYRVYFHSLRYHPNAARLFVLSLLDSVCEQWHTLYPRPTPDCPNGVGFRVLAGISAYRARRKTRSPSTRNTGGAPASLLCARALGRRDWRVRRPVSGRIDGHHTPVR